MVPGLFVSEAIALPPQAWRSAAPRDRNRQALLPAPVRRAAPPAAVAGKELRRWRADSVRC